MLTVKSFTFNPFAENTYLVYDDQIRDALIIDPGCFGKEEQDQLASYITQHELTPVQLINTHCHLDHIFGNAWAKRTYGLELYAHPNERANLEMAPIIAQNYGVPGIEKSELDHELTAKDTIAVGDSQLDILFLPGHSPGHIALVHAADGWCIAGDVLFNGSIGRTDLPGGNYDQLMDSIYNTLYTLPDDTKIWPGHGPATTISKEKQTNPFCALEKRQ